MQDTKPSLEYNIVGIKDPFGPSIVEADMGCIVVSQETLKGGHAVNTKRKEKVRVFTNTGRNLEIICSKIEGENEEICLKMHVLFTGPCRH